VEFTEVGDLHMLPYVALEFINLLQGCSSNGAIIDMHDNDDKLTGRPSSEVDSLVNRALRKTQLVNEDLHQMLVPAAPTLF